ncbi:MAG: cytochrome c3 family protein [Planctomycetota bacterium]
MANTKRTRFVGTMLVTAYGAFVLLVSWQAESPSVAENEPTQTALAESEYVGKKVCGECHAKNYEWHSHHGHASTFAVVADTELPTELEGQTFDAGPEYGTYEYRRRDDGQLIASLFGNASESELPLQYALGSGMHARTFLTLVPSDDPDPSGLEHRATLYHDGSLGITPGQAGSSPDEERERFGDIHAGLPLRRCVYCHVTTGEIVGEEIVGLTANVNCEKCHGPGGEHVRQARANLDPLPPFSVGESRWDAEAEIQLCGDCHRMPRDITEREVREYPDVLVRFQPIGLLRSRCFLESEQTLRCSSCHNPHQTTQDTTAETSVAQCVACHTVDKEDHVACPVSPTTGCVQCHMPAVEVADGLRFHDHWIRVREPKKETSLE